MMTYLKCSLKSTFVELLVLVFCLSLNTKSLAAGDYREGYIVINPGDTIYGFTDYEE